MFDHRVVGMKCFTSGHSSLPSYLNDSNLIVQMYRGTVQAFSKYTGRSALIVGEDEYAD